MTRPLLLGHRGARACKDIPENTLASFDRALADGCHGFEFDIRLTADGQAVVCHDPKVGNLQIASASSHELSALPKLEDVLEHYRKAFLDIELKVRGLERMIIAQLREFEPQRFVVSSFLPEILKTLYELDPKLPLGLICETRGQLQKWPRLPVGYVIPNYKLVNRDLIRELHEADKRVLVWTVNQPAAMRQFSTWEVDGIISDETKLLTQTLTLKS